MTGEAPDILRPDDPHNLIGNNWPPESEEAYRSAEHAADTGSLISSSAVTYSVTAADDTDAEMNGQTADKLVSVLESSSTGFQRDAADFTTASGWMLAAGEAVADAKGSIVSLVADGTEAIDAAEAEEAAGKKPETSSDDLKTQYRSAISGQKTNLDNTLSGIGHALAGDPGAPTAPGYVGVPTHPTPAQPGPSPVTQQQMLTSDAGTKPPGQPAPPQQQLPPIHHADQPGAQQPGHPGHHGGAPSMPGAPAAPSAGSPGTGGLGGSGGLGNPSGGLGGQGGLGSQGGLGDPGSLNPLGIGNPGSTSPTTSGTGTGAPAGSTPDTGSPAAALGDASLAGGLAGLSGLAGAAGPALGGIPIAGAAGAPGAAAGGAGQFTSPSYPAGTGSTPGMAAPLGPIGSPGGSVSPVNPTVPSGTTGTPGSSGTPATPPVAAPGPGQPTGPAPTPKVDTTLAAKDTWAAAAVTQRGTSATPLVGVTGAEDEKRPAAETTYVAELTEAERTAHLVLASLRLSFAKADWPTPLAVAITADEAGRTEAVFASADGLSIIPRGVWLPAGMTPLCDHPDRPGPGLLGYADPAAKLAGLPGLVALVSSTATAEGTVQTDAQAVELLAAEAAPTGSVQRGDGADPTQAPMLVAQAVAVVPGVGDPESVAPYLRGLRWVSEQPARYVSTFATWLVAEALTAYQEGALSEAAYLASQALDLLGGGPATQVGDAS